FRSINGPPVKLVTIVPKSVSHEISVPSCVMGGEVAGYSALFHLTQKECTRCYSLISSDE
ncbi:MAG: hypothetical protein V7695_24015, partial [Sulfitobacter sp.]